MPWIAMSWSHKQQEIEIALEATRASLKVYKNALDSGVTNFLIGPSIKPVFRKYN
jgi:glutamate-1-semialdehyde 2,1-aminomutase